MGRTHDDARRWQREGTALLLRAVDQLAPDQFGVPSALAGWSRKYLVAHVAANADALLNLVTWARTGVETPMYASAQARTREIERGSRLSVAELTAWLSLSAAALGAAMDALTDRQWATEVVTAQGRTVPATETPWMRSREVFVHAVDLATGISFTQLPEDFLVALQTDIVGKRGQVPAALGTIGDVTAWLAGRPYTDVVLPDGSLATPLGPWL